MTEMGGSSSSAPPQVGSATRAAHGHRRRLPRPPDRGLVFHGLGDDDAHGRHHGLLRLPRQHAEHDHGPHAYDERGGQLQPAVATITGANPRVCPDGAAPTATFTAPGE